MVKKIKKQELVSSPLICGNWVEGEKDKKGKAKELSL